MDVIGEVVRSVRVGHPGARLLRPADGGLRFTAFDGSGFHIVLSGPCWLITDQDDPVELRPGDVVLASSGGEHGLAAAPVVLRDLPALVPGPFPPATGPAAFEFLCGAYRLEGSPAPQYLRTLPNLVVVSPDQDRAPRLRALTDLLRAEVSANPAGDEATLPALLDLVLVHALRQWHEEHDVAGERLTDDPAVAAVLRQIHGSPELPWTVDRLSRAAGLSRTAFSRRFTTAVGQPPMRYLTCWRMQRAAALLRTTDAPLAAIARQVGYATEFAFSAAFRRERGLSPGQFRRAPERSRTDGVIPPGCAEGG